MGTVHTAWRRGEAFARRPSAPWRHGWQMLRPYLLRRWVFLIPRCSCRDRIHRFSESCGLPTWPRQRCLLSEASLIRHGLEFPGEEPSLSSPARAASTRQVALLGGITRAQALTDRTTGLWK